MPRVILIIHKGLGFVGFMMVGAQYVSMKETPTEKSHVCLCGKWFNSKDELEEHLKDSHQ